MNDLPTLKIHLFGKDKVGKTTLRNKIISGNENIESTKFIELSTKTINEKYMLLLVDYPGYNTGVNIFNI